MLVVEKIKMGYRFKYDKNEYELDIIPDKCPFCHHGIKPIILYPNTVRKEEGDYLHLLLNCPRSECNESFIAYYERVGAEVYDYLEYTSTGNLVKNVFSKTITDISKIFVQVYNQSLAAEQMKLTEICGVGYRKALEFLIKDYSIKNNPKEKDKIEKKMLAQCISEYVDDNRIKSVAKRAVWLGNDETHYIKKWEGKTLSDLKKLIDLTLHWIEAEVLTKSFEDEMPET